ncbi:hypothetical protein IGB42_00357 [Andreprevotia sp. IGB-42]|uniref:MipA/OmpV family protein n=1 Tax=Andreprevotia sp. IGB-42 TaxID=2497473 RepID=UPI001357F186|nr:MipA/OmpV family protein [Andreprevotia sp. IGB-42]KAF0815276.1 hypothetical protein IGB42_00357 [Andreprevotia sp. IGB-42]
MPCLIQRVLITIFCAGSLSAAFSQVDLPQLPNLVGAAVGVTTECSGCKDTMVGVVPGVRYVTESGRLIEWYGPYAQYNFGGLQGLQWGPAVNLKLGRSDLSDSVLNALPEIDTTIEFGGYVGYQYINAGEVPYTWRVGANVLTNAGSVYDGARLNVSTTGWLPLSRRFLIGAGTGFSWASRDFMNTYYGIDAAGAKASGLPGFAASGGAHQVIGWLGAIYQLHPNWYAGAGVFDQYLMGSAANTPIVTQRGTRNQLTYGVGLGYVWSP